MLAGNRGGDFDRGVPDHPAVPQTTLVSQLRGAADVSNFGSAVRCHFQAGVCLTRPKAVASLTAAGCSHCCATDWPGAAKPHCIPQHLLEPHHSPEESQNH